jgi:hypothetical protein
MGILGSRSARVNPVPAPGRGVQIGRNPVARKTAHWIVAVNVDPAADAQLAFAQFGRQSDREARLCGN